MDWYEKHIEEPIRPLVKLLRENGYNTMCSCGHEMYVEREYYGDSVKPLFDLLFNNEYEHFRVEAFMGIDEVGVMSNHIVVWILTPI